MLVSVVAALLCAAPSSGPRVATTPWRTVKVEADVVAFYEDRLARELRVHGLDVITPADIASVLGLERQKALLGCNESGCAVELGDALGATTILSGSIAKLGDTLSATVRIISTKDGHVVTETVIEAGDEKTFLKKLADVGDQLAEGLKPVAPPTPAPKLVGRALAITGGVVLAGGIVSRVLAQLESTNLDAELKTSQMVTTKAREIAARGTTEELLGWVGVGVGAGLLVGGLLLDLLWPSSPVQVAAVPSPGGLTFALGGVFP